MYVMYMYVHRYISKAKQKQTNRQTDDCRSSVHFRRRQHTNSSTTTITTAKKTNLHCRQRMLLPASPPSPPSPTMQPRRNVLEDPETVGAFNTAVAVVVVVERASFVQ